MPFKFHSVEFLMICKGSLIDRGFGKMETRSFFGAELLIDKMIGRILLCILGAV